MTSASSLAFPGSRTLATWWRQLAPLGPRGLGVGYLFLHRLDVLALWRRPQPLDPLLLLVLEALALQQNGPSAWIELCKSVRLADAILRRLLQSLIRLQLVESAPAGITWQLTEAGQEALRTKCTWSHRQQRGQFSFLEGLGPTGNRVKTPHYLKINDAPASPWHVEESFDIKWLHACQDQTPEWKNTFGFPADLLAFAPPGDNGTAWEKIILDKPERVLVVFFQSSKHGDDLLGIGVRPEGWQLNATEPIIRLPAAAIEILAEPNSPPPLDAFRNSWHGWCHARAVPQTDAHDCRLSLSGECLRVAAPERLMQYFQATKSDVLKGETWLLAGEGYVRQAARLEFVT